MAWIIGLVTNEELEKLRDIGWEDEDPPEELTPDEESGDSHTHTRAFFVDSNVFEVMTGADWTQPNEHLASRDQMPYDGG